MAKPPRRILANCTFRCLWLMPFNMHFVLYLICTQNERQPRKLATRSQLKLQLFARLGHNGLLGIRWIFGWQMCRFLSVAFWHFTLGHCYMGISWLIRRCRCTRLAHQIACKLPGNWSPVQSGSVQSAHPKANWRSVMKQSKRDTHLTPAL